MRRKGIPTDPEALLDTRSGSRGDARGTDAEADSSVDTLVDLVIGDEPVDLNHPKSGIIEVRNEGKIDEEVVSTGIDKRVADPGLTNLFS